MAFGWVKKGLKKVGEGAVDLADTGVSAVKGGVDTAVKTAKDLPRDASAIAQDPVGYIKDKVGPMTLGAVKGAAGTALENVAKHVASQVGLEPLVEGIASFADQVADIVAKILQMALCLKWVETPAFYAVSGVLYAARFEKLVQSKDDCYQFVRTGQFLKAVGEVNLPLVDLLPCAIETAFMAPLPSSSSGERPDAAAIRQRVNASLSSSSIWGAMGVLEKIGKAATVADVRNAASSPSVGVASRSTDKLDIIIARSDGAVVTAAWRPGDKAWRGWWPVADGRSTPGAPIAAVSRSTDRLDVFMIGLEGRVWNAAWGPGDKTWWGWAPIGDLKTLPGARIGAVSRAPDKLDVFATGADGAVYTAAWQSGDKPGAWRGWWPVANGRSTPGAPITVVSRSTDRLDVFMVGLDGRVWNAAWGLGDKTWWGRGWWPVANGRSTPGAPITAVSRSTDRVDVFMVGLDGRVWTAAWGPGDKAWNGWWAIGSLSTAPAGYVSCVSRSKDKLDIFVTGINQAIYSAAWQPGDKEWRGWWQLS